jgi:hypothetical protein
MRDETPEGIRGTTSDLAALLAYGFTTRYAPTHTGLVTLAYVLGFALSFLTPHPFPPTLLFMVIVSAVIDRARMDPADAIALGFATFISATATSMIPLTGNSLLHPVTIGFAGVQVSSLGASAPHMSGVRHNGSGRYAEHSTHGSGSGARRMSCP